jgi:hypothetical protein
MEAVLMVGAVLLLALVFLGIPSLAKAIVRRRQTQAPPAYPAARRRDALSRAADDRDWDWPR